MKVSQWLPNTIQTGVERYQLMVTATSRDAFFHESCQMAHNILVNEFRIEAMDHHGLW